MKTFKLFSIAFTLMVAMVGQSAQAQLQGKDLSIAVRQNDQGNYVFEMFSKKHSNKVVAVGSPAGYSYDQLQNLNLALNKTFFSDAGKAFVGVIITEEAFRNMRRFDKKADAILQQITAKANQGVEFSQESRRYLIKRSTAMGLSLMAITAISYVLFQGMNMHEYNQFFRSDLLHSTIDFGTLDKEEVTVADDADLMRSYKVLSILLPKAAALPTMAQ